MIYEWPASPAVLEKPSVYLIGRGDWQRQAARELDRAFSAVFYSPLTSRNFASDEARMKFLGWQINCLIDCDVITIWCDHDCVPWLEIGYMLGRKRPIVIGADSEGIRVSLRRLLGTFGYRDHVNFTFDETVTEARLQARYIPRRK
jgi:hypothetical protein